MLLLLPVFVSHRYAVVLSAVLCHSLYVMLLLLLLLLLLFFLGWKYMRRRRRLQVRRGIEDFWKDAHTEAGYDILYTPHVANLNLWKTSGHYDFYKEGMFDQMEVEGDQYQIKPMNCPFHCLVFKDSLR
jgi:hypothetical protein